jgi:hypothetical protein
MENGMWANLESGSSEEFEIEVAVIWAENFVRLSRRTTLIDYLISLKCAEPQHS